MGEGEEEALEEVKRRQIREARTRGRPLTDWGHGAQPGGLLLKHTVVERTLLRVNP